MLNKRQLATVTYALRYLIANYDDAIAYDSPKDISHLFKEYQPLSEYELIKLADTFEGQNFEPRLYQLEISGRLRPIGKYVQFVSQKIWNSPEECLAQQDEITNKFDWFDRSEVKVKVIELSIG